MLVSLVSVGADGGVESVVEANGVERCERAVAEREKCGRGGQTLTIGGCGAPRAKVGVRCGRAKSSAGEARELNAGRRGDDGRMGKIGAFASSGA